MIQCTILAGKHAKRQAEQDLDKPKGVAWNLVKDSVAENHTIDNSEQGFEVAVVHDATASAKMDDLDGDKAAKTNFRMIASASWSTNETVDKLKSSHR